MRRQVSSYVESIQSYLTVLPIFLRFGIDGPREVLEYKALPEYPKAGSIENLSDLYGAIGTIILLQTDPRINSF